MQQVKPLLLTLPIDLLDEIKVIAEEDGLSQCEKLKEWIFLGATRRNEKLKVVYQAFLSEVRLRERVLRLARDLDTRDPDLILKIFKEIRQDQELFFLYKRAIAGCGPGGKGRGRKGWVNNRIISAVLSHCKLEVLKSESGRAKRVRTRAELVDSYPQTVPLSR